MSDPQSTTAPAARLPGPVLFVDDEPDLIETFVNNFEDVFQILTAGNGPDAIELIRAHDVAVMVTDQRMPGMHGLEVIQRALEIRPDLIPIILTGFTNDRDLITAINLQRIHRYIPKPWEPAELTHTIEGAIEKHRLVRENRRLAAELQEANERLRAENAYLKATDAPKLLVGDSPAIKRLLDEIRRMAPKDVTVLIQGETGTGKELVARSIHGASSRHERMFVAVNCAELSQDAAESRLFGHRKGSFTGAIDDHKGFFEVADGGTLFLDEIGELPLGLQAKLLRVLQEGEIVRFGESKPRKVSVRVIAATNRRLDDEVKAGRFREDLLYRLNVVPVRVPPLRERRDDVPLLAEHFLKLHARKMRIAVPRLTPEARDVLGTSTFAGNVRDLENVIVRGLVMSESEGVVTAADLQGLTAAVGSADEIDDVEPTNGAASLIDEAGGLLDRVSRFERQQIERALEDSGGNRTKAARALKISKRWLLKKLERYGNVDGSDDEAKG
jgi:two-component system response regulator HupR/HoxA